ncbi:MAG: hypothetical protein IJP49_05845 [Bacteroidales bacterium]|nr:hypothetical protein [Bacteroidales bacterium]
MKKSVYLMLAVLTGLFVSQSSFAIQDPDVPGTKLITFQAGGGPGFGGLVSGNIAIANLGATHLYGGLQLGVDLHSGYGSKRTDLSLAPRITLGFNLSRVVELHFGGLAGIAMRKISSTGFSPDPSLLFCYGGLGGFRFNISPSVGIILEGCYSNCMPYGTGGIALRF